MNIHKNFALSESNSGVLDGFGILEELEIKHLNNACTMYQCTCHVIPTWLLISSLGKYTEQSLDNSIIATPAHQHTIEAILQKRNSS